MLLCKKISIKKVFCISLILYIIGTLYSTYSPITNRFLNIESINYIINKLGARNGIFYGFFYFSLGGYITTLNCKKNIKNYWLCFIFFILLAIECLAGTYLHVKTTILWFMTPFVVYNLFVIAITNEININDRTAKYIRNSSTLIYVSQFIFIYLLKTLMIPQYSVKMFCLTVLFCSLFSIVIIFLSKKIKMLKYLY